MNKEIENDSSYICEYGLSKNAFKRKEQKLGMVLFFIIIFALIPLYFISSYAHPSVDDYSYGKFTAQVWQETGSLKDVIYNALQRTGHTYKTWQGTFSSIFLMRLEPAIFGEQYYFLTTVLLLTMFVLCNILFYIAFFSKLFDASLYQGWILSAILSLGAVEFTHVISDSFYWYNGGITYTFFYSMEILLFTLLIFLYCAKKRVKKNILGFLSIIVAFFTCGGNYVTSLVTVEILFFICVILVLYYYKKKKLADNFQNIFLFAFVGIAALAGFLLAVLAPGNAMRQAEVGEAMNPFLAVLLSFVYGIYSMGNCLKLPVLVLFLCCIPCFIMISKKSNFSFRYPGIVTIFSYCLYSSQITPVIYAQGLKIPYRIMNIIYFSCFIMVGINLFYWIGYWVKKEIGNIIIEKFLFLYQKYFSHIYFFLFMFFCFTVVGDISIKADIGVNNNTQMTISRMPASISACFSLINGEAKQYDKEAWKRYHTYADQSIKDVVVREFSVKPEIIFHSDITENPKNWKNKCVKKYFNKKSVKIGRTDSYKQNK